MRARESSKDRQRPPLPGRAVLGCDRTPADLTGRKCWRFATVNRFPVGIFSENRVNPARHFSRIFTTEE